MLGKKNIQKFGKIHDYLKDGDFRFKEVGTQRILVKDADFSGASFNESGWEYFDFSNCIFSGQILLDWLGDCTFIGCDFQGILGFGEVENVRFLDCKIRPAHIGFDDGSKGLVFENCEFYNPDSDVNHRSSVISSGEIIFIACKGRNFAWDGYKKLTLRRCTVRGGSLGTAPYGLYVKKLDQLPYSDFLLEDCDLGSVDMDNSNLNTLILRNCKVGVLKTWHSTIRDSALIEGIKVGFISLASTTITKSLTVRNCSFYKTYEGHSFKCNTDTPVHSLLENIECGSAPVDAICSGGPMKESDWLPVASNQSTIIKNCKIPHLKIDWAQTEHLRIENCKFDYLDIKNGRIGRLEIISCSLRKLDVSNTQVKTHDVRVPEGGKISGHVTVTTGSNIKLPHK
jgi:uncharacterized protein YjbI with pentapeptide repeats